jgi:PPOX class probable F420-dependent enzyme
MSIPAEYVDILASKSFWHIATIGPDGTPQSSPVWVGYDGTNVRFSLTRTRQKFHNLTANPDVALSAQDPDNPYRYLEIRGKVIAVESDDDNAFIDSMAKKYMDADAYPFHKTGDERVVMVVTPGRTSAMG